MRIIDGKHVVLFGADWSQDELMKLANSAGCQLKRHDSGAIEIIRKPASPKVVPIRQVRGIELAAIRNQDQPKPKQHIPFLSGLFPFGLPDHEGPGVA